MAIKVSGANITIDQSAGLISGTIGLSADADTLNISGGDRRQHPRAGIERYRRFFGLGNANTFTYSSTISGVTTIDLASGELVLGTGGSVVGG